MANEVVKWVAVPGSADKVTSDGRYIAVYDRTYPNGYANYFVYSTAVPKSRRSAKTRLVVGGLPTKVENLSIEDYNVTVYGK